MIKVLNEARNMKNIRVQLYQLVRLHSKLITLYCNVIQLNTILTDEQSTQIVDATKSLHALLQCYFGETTNEYLLSYIKQISVTLYHLENKDSYKTIKESIQHASGILSKLNKYVKKENVKLEFCELDFQKSVLPIYFLEKESGLIKKNHYSS